MPEHTLKIQKSTASKSHASKPFFNKSGEGSFFPRPREVQKPFFNAYPIQAKLKVGRPGDKYEQEADLMADKVVQKLENPSLSKNGMVMRKPIFESDDDSQIQRKSIENQLNASKGRGKPMAKGVKSNMESAFGSDFSQVKIHSDSASIQMNKDLNSKAFTNASDVYFNSGEYNPSTKAGKGLLAHELTHVVQQKRSFSRSIQRDSNGSNKKPAQPVKFQSYTTFVVPTSQGPDLIIQFFRKPGDTDGAMFRFKAQGDLRPPLETPIPSQAIFSPEIVNKTNDSIAISLTGDKKPDLEIYYAAGNKIEQLHAINPKKPFGPLRMNQKFRRTVVEAIIYYNGNSDRYSFLGNLPDNAISPPKWRRYMHGGRLPGWIAVQGKYRKRVLLFGSDISPNQVGINKGFEAGLKTSLKMFASFAIYSTPYVGAVILVGEAIIGKNIWGDKLSLGERLLFGYFGLINVAASAKGVLAEARAIRKLSTSSNISINEAKVLIRGAKNFTKQEEAFVNATANKIKQGIALTEAEATEIAVLMKRIGTVENLVFSGANDIGLIWRSRRYWGMTEGAVYGARMPVNTFWQRAKAMVGKKEGMVIFQGNAAKLFHAHKVEGGYSAMKRLLGQQKAGFGDIIFVNATKTGNTIIVTEARMATAGGGLHLGQSTTWATARLWGRRVGIEPFATVFVPTSGYGVYMVYEYLTEDNEDKK